MGVQITAPFGHLSGGCGNAVDGGHRKAPGDGAF